MSQLVLLCELYECHIKLFLKYCCISVTCNLLVTLLKTATSKNESGNVSLHNFGLINPSLLVSDEFCEVM
jgi:hypothetical protein